MGKEGEMIRHHTLSIKLFTPHMEEVKLGIEGLTVGSESITQLIYECSYRGLTVIVESRIAPQFSLCDYCTEFIQYPCEL